ncbi:MAG: RNA 2'-phosphotransferase [bacterium]
MEPREGEPRRRQPADPEREAESAEDREDLSRYLSYLLRHHPEDADFRVDDRGWASIEEMVAGARAVGRKLTVNDVMRVVETDPKGRFALSDDRLSIRANYGHSMPVDLGLEAETPPEILYHGTAYRFREEILEKGIEPRERQHVHLSERPEEATDVGRRHGRPALIQVEALRMTEEGFAFYRSESEAGIWLTREVPPEYLSLPDEEEEETVSPEPGVPSEPRPRTDTSSPGPEPPRRSDI